MLPKKFSLFITMMLCCLSHGSVHAQGIPDTVQARIYLTRGAELAARAQLDSANVLTEQARVIFDRATQRFNDGNAWAGLVSALNLLGNNARKQGAYDKALALLQDALQRGESRLGAAHAQVGISYGLLGMVYWNKGEYALVEPYLQKALLLKRQAFGENHLEVAHAYNNFGIYYWNKGDYERALSHYLKALEIRRTLFGEHHVQVGHSYNNIGIVYWNKGDYERAMQYYLKAQTVLLQTLEETDPAISNLYNNLAILYDERGDYDMALVYYSKSCALRQRLLGENHSEVGASFANLGDTYYRKGEYAEAEKNLLRGLRIYEQTLEKNHSNFAQCYLSLGMTYAARNEQTQALAYYERAREVYTNAFGANTPEVTTVYNKMGESYAALGRHDAAQAAQQQALAIARQALGGRHPLVAETEYHLGNLFFVQKKNEAALRHYQNALLALTVAANDSAVSSNPPLETLPQLAWLSELLGAKAQALHARFNTTHNDIATLHAALATHHLNAAALERLRTVYQSEDSKLLLAEHTHANFEAAIKTALALYAATHDTAYLRQAFVFAEKSKAAVLAEALYESRARQFAGIPDSVLERERELRLELTYCETQIQKEKSAGAERDSARQAEFEQRRFKFQTEHQNFITHLEKNYSKYFELKYHRAEIQIDQLQRALAPYDMLLEYFVGDSSLYVFAISPQRFHVITQKKPQDFDYTVAEFLRAIKKVEKPAFVQHGRRLHEILLRPLQTELAGVRSLRLIPDGVLCYVPFEALLTRTSPARDYSKLPYLIRDYEISYHASAHLWQESMNIAPQVSEGFAGFAPVFNDSTQSGYIFAQQADDPQFADLRAITVAGKRYGPLPHSEKEVAAIAQLFARKGQSSIAYFHQQATEANFKQALLQPRFVHVATHGLLLEEQPKLSGLLFSQTQERANTEDGVLYSGETYNLHTRAELVVLSSCESGVGRFVQGEGLLALTRGFMYSGVPNLMVSLWKVYDKHTSTLMLAFYENVLRRENFGAALRAAKLRMLNEPATAAPAKWSAFILIGK